MIELNNVLFSYNKKKTFGPINATFQPGSVNVIIGHNGAGKSTLIQLILGGLKSKSGKITVDGDINYMPDDLFFPQYLKVKEIIALLGGMKKLSLENTNTVLKSVGLEHTLNQYVKSFSKGMVQRLNIAQSLMGNAKILIMDEPTNGLDPIWIERLSEMLIEEKQKGKTIIITTHQLDFALKVADAIYILKDNNIQHMIENKSIQASDLLSYYQ